MSISTKSKLRSPFSITFDKAAFSQQMYNLPPKAGRSTLVTLLLLNATTANQCCVCTAKQTGAVSPNLFAFQTSYTYWILVQSSLVFYKKLQGEGKKVKGEHLVDTQISSQQAGMLLWHIPGYSNFYFLLFSFNPFLDKSLNIPIFSFSKSIKQVPLCLGIHSSMY